MVVNGFSRRVRREHLEMGQRVALLEDDADAEERARNDNSKAISALQTEVENTNRWMMRLVLVIAGAAVTLAANLFVEMAKGL